LDIPFYPLCIQQFHTLLSLPLKKYYY